MTWHPPTGSFIHPLIPFIEFQTFIGNCKRIEANKASIKISLDIIYLYMYVDLRQTSDGQITPSISDVYPIHLIIQTRLYIISDTLKTIKFASRYKLIIYGWLVYFGQSDIFYKNKSIDYLNVLLRTSACFIELTLWKSSSTSRYITVHWALNNNHLFWRFKTCPNY